MKLRIVLLVLFAGWGLTARAQLYQSKETFTRADTLRGMLTPLRTCYDINYYHLDVKFDIPDKSISGSNLFRFTATQDFNKLQFDLFDNLKIEKIIYKGQGLSYKREFNAVFITFPQTIAKGSRDEFTVYYSGNPVIAKNAPWDGGLVFKTDSERRPWVATACEGIGASVWWPNKDHLSDEVDSMMISISVPTGLKDVSNGRLRKVTDLYNGYTRFDWFVANPINNYDVAANIGNYTHYTDIYNGEKGKLDLDYWVLHDDLDKAKKQFGNNVKPMLQSFEHWFGPYPFYEDSYKLVETPYLGMEHQSAISYGNQFQDGYLGRDLSGTGWGSKWDYIVVHESGHEWFGNNITAKDIADEWIHEAFACYSESLFVESQWGREAAREYIYGLRSDINNDRPVIGIYGVNKEGSGDMYNKGAVLLNMVRTIINDDQKWRHILRGLGTAFYHKTVTYDDIVGYICTQSGMDLKPVFDQYLKTATLPVLEIVTGKDNKLYCLWTSCIKDFNMPVNLRIKGGRYKMINVTTGPTLIDIGGANKDNVEYDDQNYYIGLLVNQQINSKY